MIYTDEECVDLSHNAWYLDDDSLAGKSASVLSALNIVSSQGPALGFNINLKKCDCMEHETSLHSPVRFRPPTHIA